MYSNFEEIQKEYPIGKPLHWAKEYTQEVFYYTEKDLEIYLLLGRIPVLSQFLKPQFLKLKVIFLMERSSILLTRIGMAGKFGRKMNEL